MIDSYTKNKWDQIDTVQDLLDFMEDPKCDVMGMSNALVDIDKSSFWTAANVEFDINLSEILNSTPAIRHDEISATTMVPSELEYHKKNSYTNGYDRIKPNADLSKIVKALGFGDNSSVWVNNQPPGVLMGRHVDFISCFTYENLDNASLVNTMKYDKDKSQPVELKTIWRCFVALDDWHPGQLVNFEPGFWTHWKKGDVVFFDWKNTPHSTANCGSKHRPFLKITGVIDDDKYVISGRENNHITKFKV